LISRCSNSGYHSLGNIAWNGTDLAANFTLIRIPKFLGYFERILKANAKGGDFIFDKKITYVDLSLFQMIEGLRYAFPKTMARLEPQHPRLVT